MALYASPTPRPTQFFQIHNYRLNVKNKGSVNNNLINHGLQMFKEESECNCAKGGRRVIRVRSITEQTAAAAAAGPHHSKHDVSSKLVLVVGGAGGVGQLIVARLLDRGIRAHVLIRDSKKAETLFGKQDTIKLQAFVGDTRHPEELDSSVFEGVTHVICCTGTTAFPSRRWAADNTPEKTDWDGVRNLVTAMPSSVKRFVLVSSVGVTKFDELPWSIMNLFGVLIFKKMGEEFLRNSGVPFTIIRPGRLTDGPYTSYDLNTLLKATAGTRRAVLIGQGDKLVGEASRHDVAEACIQALDMECTLGQTYEINSVEGVLQKRWIIHAMVSGDGKMLARSSRSPRSMLLKVGVAQSLMKAAMLQVGHFLKLPMKETC